MGLIKLEKGQILHRAGLDIVSTIEVLVSGSVKISNPYSSITHAAGCFIGIVETPGKPYNYTIEALENSSVYSYPFESADDIPKIVKSLPKVAPILAAQSADTAAACSAVYENQFDDAMMEYEKIMADFADYPRLCIMAGEASKEFPEIDALIPPERSGRIPQWTLDYTNSLKENEDVLRSSFYPISVDIAVGMVMSTFNIYKSISEEVLMLNEYRKVLRKRTAGFVAEMNDIRSKLSGMENPAADSESAKVVVENALEVILSYSGVKNETAEAFRLQISAFKQDNNRYGSSDQSRILRRNITTTFYEIYTNAFLKSLTDASIPAEVRMFFMFGFVDEELAGKRYTSILYNMAKAYTPDPNVNVLTLYEWLKKIYMLEIEPSKNEFDQDWKTYLKEQQSSGAINASELNDMINNRQKRLRFEIKNLFTLGNRMTFGRLSSFVPVFDELNILRPLDMAYLTSARVNEYFETIRSIDPGVFCRQSFYSKPEAGIKQLPCSEDITPYVILMPNIGSRAFLWQEIEGRNRHTKARMIISIFNTENTDEAMIKLFGEFRWEMCKAEQGVHWNDVTDPSLTSVYSDYLQFYRKNYSLTTANKEKLRADLKRFGNRYKSLFVADYLVYIKYEAEGSLRLNKVARQILFTYCPFSRKIREKVSANPQYAELINRHMSAIGNKVRILTSTMTKLNKEGDEIPAILNEQLEFLQK